MACSALSVGLDNMVDAVEAIGEPLPSWRQSGSSSVLCGDILICMVYNKASQCITSAALSTVWHYFHKQPSPTQWQKFAAETLFSVDTEKLMDLLISPAMIIKKVSYIAMQVAAV